MKDGLCRICKSCNSIKVLQWQKDNKEKHNLKGCRWTKLHKEQKSMYVKIYKQNNKDRYAKLENNRRAKKLQRQFKLTELRKIQLNNIYKKAKYITETTNIKHDVDHIIPLRGKNISGLHVPWNLQIISHSDNCKKHNKFDGTYENSAWKYNEKRN